MHAQSAEELSTAEQRLVDVTLTCNRVDEQLAEGKRRAAAAAERVAAAERRVVAAEAAVVELQEEQLRAKVESARGKAERCAADAERRANSELRTPRSLQEECLVQNTSGKVVGTASAAAKASPTVDVNVCGDNSRAQPKRPDTNNSDGESDVALVACAGVNAESERGGPEWFHALGTTSNNFRHTAPASIGALIDDLVQHTGDTVVCRDLSVLLNDWTPRGMGNELAGVVSALVGVFDRHMHDQSLVSTAMQIFWAITFDPVTAEQAVAAGAVSRVVAVMRAQDACAALQASGCGTLLNLLCGGIQDGVVGAAVEAGRHATPAVLEQACQLLYALAHLDSRSVVLAGGRDAARIACALPSTGPEEEQARRWGRWLVEAL